MIQHVMHASDLVPLGRTKLRVTRLGLGTAGIGNLFEAVTDEEARQVIERAYASGIRFFDTAPLYGYGLAEQRVGSALGDKPRDEFVLATKAGRLLRAGNGPTRASSLTARPSTSRRRRSLRSSTSATTA